jgi:hypothetical protein
MGSMTLSDREFNGPRQSTDLRSEAFEIIVAKSRNHALKNLLQQLYTKVLFERPIMTAVVADGGRTRYRGSVGILPRTAQFADCGTILSKDISPYGNDATLIIDHCLDSG